MSAPKMVTQILGSRNNLKPLPILMHGYLCLEWFLADLYQDVGAFRAKRPRGQQEQSLAERSINGGNRSVTDWRKTHVWRQRLLKRYGVAQRISQGV